MIPQIQQIAVNDKKWMTEEEMIAFLEMLAAMEEGEESEEVTEEASEEITE